MKLKGVVHHFVGREGLKIEKRNELACEVRPIPGPPLHPVLPADDVTLIDRVMLQPISGLFLYERYMTAEAKEKW